MRFSPMAFVQPPQPIVKKKTEGFPTVVAVIGIKWQLRTPPTLRGVKFQGETETKDENTWKDSDFGENLGVSQSQTVKNFAPDFLFGHKIIGCCCSMLLQYINLDRSKSVLNFVIWLQSENLLSYFLWNKMILFVFYSSI
ncbi:hypothetical protein K2173_004630 [Erythroxylum novogranatense]|uniref:Uncharacterized protein n=1 Tax=Erythroxylum novogranatense TaxID=1862640 RepID=A0AAV8UCW5_9ROSI|nr:hypothetical protein K2173_004630 [Erythroxylum novogranatense]